MGGQIVRAGYSRAIPLANFWYAHLASHLPHLHSFVAHNDRPPLVAHKARYGRRGNVEKVTIHRTIFTTVRRKINFAANRHSQVRESVRKEVYTTILSYVLLKIICVKRLFGITVCYLYHIVYEKIIIPSADENVDRVRLKT